MFDARGRYLARLAALFHDVSRFKQYREFQTFRDADSFDHGEMSAEIFLHDFPMENGIVISRNPRNGFRGSP